MYLRKLEIFGFKSFAKKTVLEFEPGITSIVGPNGAGKSNVADSLRFCFGEQSMKLLRGKKSPDIIFAGSDQRARLGTAEVSIYFDNTDHKIPIDYNEVVLSRRVYRDGNSDYLINGNLVRLLDIQELLAKSGFGNTSYYVIGQGMIDQLILGGPAAIKELIEEASGVKPYYIKRGRTIRRLERTEVNLEQIQALVAEIEPRLRSLKRQTRKLKLRADLEQELKKAQILHFGQILRGLDQQIQEVNSKTEIFQKQMTELSGEIVALASDIEISEKQISEGDGRQKKFQVDLDELHQQKYKLQEELATIRGQLKALTNIQEGRLLLIDWHDLHKKFKDAYERLEVLFENFDPKEAKAVQELFREIYQIIESANSAHSQGRNKEETQTLESEEQRVNSELEKLFSQIRTLKIDIQNYLEETEGAKQQLFVKEHLLRAKQEMQIKTAEQKNLLAIEQAKLLTRRETIEQEARSELGPNYKGLLEQTKSLSIPIGLQEKIATLKKQVLNIGGVDDLVMQEYRETEERYQYLVGQSADLKKGVQDLKKVIAELDEIIKKEFHEAFIRISERFAEYFRILFGGGKATMSILRETPKPEITEDDVEETFGSPSGSLKASITGEETRTTEIVGIEIRATPPGKKLAGISALSGGERALTSIALLCALLASYPSPFVVLDEVDAALDEANSVRFAKILGTLASKIQFITITHNRETMRQSHTLYGVTMGDDGVSKILSLRLEQAAEYSSKN